MKTFMVKIDRWFGSNKIGAMRQDEEGALLRLFLYMADSEDGSLPDDDNELAMMSRLRELWFEKPKRSNLTRGERIRQCFYLRTGRLRNEMVDEDIEKCALALEQKRNAGVTSGQRRGQRKPNGKGTDVGSPFERETNTRSRSVRTEDERSLSSRSPSVHENSVKKRSESEQTGNGEATGGQREANGDTNREATGDERGGNGEATGRQPLPLPLPPPPPSPPPPSSSSVRKPGDDDSVRQVQRWLTEFTHAEMGEAPPDVCRKVLNALGNHSLDDLQERLILKAKQGHRPRKSWMWFVTLAENEFGSNA